jgi:hypothetical protein
MLSRALGQLPVCIAPRRLQKRTGHGVNRGWMFKANA